MRPTATKTIIVAVIAMLMASLAMIGCAEQEPGKKAGPPDPLVQEMARAKNTFNTVKEMNPAPNITSAYEQAIASADSLTSSGDYVKAMEQAKRATMLVEIAYAEAAYDQVLKFNPPQTRTYEYRTTIKEAKQALEKNDYNGTIAKAQEARKIAEALLQAEGDREGKLKNRLAELKKQIEELFQPPVAMINTFWDASDKLAAKDYNGAEQLITKLDQIVRQEQKSSYASRKYLVVKATTQDVRKFGDPRLYSDVTPEGFLKPPAIGSVSVGTPVNFVRSLLFARGKTFYLVEDPRTGLQGWISEYYVAPERVPKEQQQ